MAPGRRPPAHWPTQHVLHLRLHVTTGAGGVPTATAACSHRPADWSRDGWSGPRTSPTHCDPAVPPETPIRGASRPEGNLLSKPHGLALSPNGQEPRAPHEKSGLRRRPAASTTAGGAGHQAPGSQRRAQQKCGCRTRGRVAPALRNGAGGKASSRPRAPGCGFSVLPGPSRPLWAQPHPHGPIPAPAPSRPRTRAAAAHVGPATAGLTRLQLRLPARV